MIHYLVTSGHRYTVDEFAKLEPLIRDAVVVLPYGHAGVEDPPEPGTYVFSDLERLNADALREAQALAERLQQAGEGVRVLNDPARALRRYDLLRLLHETGVNDYAAHRLLDVVPEGALNGPASERTVELGGPRYPVFIRREDEHTKNLTPLLSSWDEVREAANGLIADPVRGYRPQDLMVVEWLDTSDAEGVFRKYGAFVIGEAIVPRALMCARRWVISDFELLDDAHLQEALDYLKPTVHPHADFLLEIARAAGIEWGRFDYAFLDGRPQIWEINTNPGILHAPSIGEIDPELHRRPAQRVAHALRAIDARPHGRLRQRNGEPTAPVAEAGGPATICLCMIVRNEAHVIERALTSVAGLIDTWLIADTGSSDETRELIRSTLRGLPGELYNSPWVNFSHNRSELMARARGRADYLLLIDADMTIRQQAPLRGLDAEAYLLRERAGLDFGVLRLVSGMRSWWYEGSTHEYLATDGQFDQVELPELVIEHHADGGSRQDKLLRDAGLLKRDLAADPNNARTVFYLGQTYRDLGEPELAIEYYRRRSNMGGWDEEVFYAKLQEGVLRARDDAEAAIPLLLEAWELRPSRAEPLYELARLYRNRGDFALAHLFSSRGLEIAYPTDILFIHGWVYAWGLRLERAIAASGIGHLEEAAADLRELRGQSHLPPPVFKYVRERLADLAAWPGRRMSTGGSGSHARLASLAPSLRIGEIKLDVEPRWPAFNPSIASDGSGFRMIVRTANYEINRGVLDGTGTIQTLNYLLALDEHLAVTQVEPIVDRSPGPARHPSQIQGYEDCRLIALDGRWYATATVGDLNRHELRRVALLTLEGADVVEVHGLEGPQAERHEKNWMPFVLDGSLCLLYSAHPTVVLRCDPATGVTESLATHQAPEIAADFRGSSQGVAVDDGFLFVVHEVDRSEPALRYLHRFILIGHDLHLASISPRFSFTSDRVEFCAGLAKRRDELILSFGISDAAAGLAVVSKEEVLGLLDPVLDSADLPT